MSADDDLICARCSRRIRSREGAAFIGTRIEHLQCPPPPPSDPTPSKGPAESRDTAEPETTT